MSDWRDYEFTVGMPHMVPNRLSEVELLKCLGSFQWDSIAHRLGRRSSEIVNGQRERLYASFVNVELAFPPPRGLDSFEEGARVGVRNRVSSYARRFVEGLFVFDSAPIPAGMTTDIVTRQDLARFARPWAYMTNAFVARAGSNSKLKVFEPEGMDAAGFPTLAAIPSGISEHQTVQGKGLRGLSGAVPGGKALRGTGAALRYPILAESDLNGAGLLYFARYVAVANYAVRRFLTEQLARPVSNPLVECLSTEHLRIYYFQNADAFDSIRIFVTAWLEAPPASPPAPDANGCRSAARFQFQTELYRASDGVLMASCLLDKSLNVPDRDRGLGYETERLLTQLRDEG
jgi:probable biosynthetic protein (TIGR04098 family)